MAFISDFMLSQTPLTHNEAYQWAANRRQYNYEAKDFKQVLLLFMCLV
jgi:hypothetical protein